MTETEMQTLYSWLEADGVGTSAQKNQTIVLVERYNRSGAYLCFLGEYYGPFNEKFVKTRTEEHQIYNYMNSIKAKFDLCGIFSRIVFQNDEHKQKFIETWMR